MRPRLPSSLVALSLLAVAATPSSAQTPPPTVPPAAPAPKDFAIIGAKVVIGDGRVMEQATLLVKDGRISSVLPGIGGFNGIETIDGKGKVVYPGFIDGYTTRLAKDAPEPSFDGRPNATETAPPFMWIGNRKGAYADWRASDNLSFDVENSALLAGFTNSYASPNKGSFRGIGSLVDLAPATVTDRIRAKDFGAAMTFRGGQGTGYPSNILGVIALMRQTLADAASLRDGAELAPKGPNAPKPTWMGTLEALQPVIKGEQPVLFEAGLDREILRAFRLGDEFGFKPAIVGGRDAYRVADVLKERGTTVILSLDYGTAPSVTPADITPMAYRQERLDRWNEQVKGVLTLQAKGVRVLLTSDGAPSQFLANLRRVISAGWSEEAAVKALTSDAAAFFGVASELGTIETGKRANLIIMSGPLADAKSTVERVFVGGREPLATKEAAK